MHGVFTEVVVNDIERKQVGLSRFINQMRYQIAMAEEKWATLYYEHLRSKLESIILYFMNWILYACLLHVNVPLDTESTLIALDNASI